MSRYIDADEFEYELKEIEAITAMTHKILGEDEEIGEISMPMFTIRNIMKRCAPIDLVRCKECRYYHQLYGCQKHDDIDLVTNDDDFCSYGEREGE